VKPPSTRRVRLLAFMAVAAAPALHAQEPPLVIARLRGTITLDGRPDEPAWRDATPLSFAMHRPTFGGTPTQRTEAWITYDDRFIYVGARLYDTEPSRIQAMSLARDDDQGGDFFNVVLDAYNDNENGNSFATTPVGARIDYGISNDTEGPNGASVSWNGVWDNATYRDSTGWSAEVRIPFSTLRYEVREGRIVMGLIVNRLIGRSQERVTFPAIPPNWRFAPFKPSFARDVVFEGVPARRPLYITPYATLGGTTRSGPDTSSARHEAGLDVRYGVTNNLNLDLTANTDFAEAEVDDERVNLTRFPLFFPERRQFFVERAGVFEFAQGSVDRLFHSRRIGLTHAGRPVRLLGGGRLVGRVAGWDLALMTMQAARADSLPSENVAVARVRRRVLNENSTVGTMVTSRAAADGSYRLAVGLDGAARLSRRDEYFRVTWARTAVSPDTAVARRGTLPDDHLRIAFERRSFTGLAYLAGWTSVGSRYDPGLGFVERRGIDRADAQLSFGFSLPNHPLLRLHRPSVSGFATRDAATRDVASALASALWRLETRTGAYTELGRDQQLERLEAPFGLSAVVSVPPGRYTFGAWNGTVSLPPGWRLGGHATLRHGGFYDGQLTSVTAAPQWLASAHLNLGLEYEHIRAKFPARAERFTADLVRVRARVYATTRLSTSAFAQYSSAAKIATANLRVRYNFREGNDLWVVLNYLAPEGTPAPALPPPERQASVLVKYSHTFRP